MGEVRQILTQKERKVAEDAMWAVHKEYGEAKAKGAKVNIWHLWQDMETARRQAVQQLKEAQAAA